MVPTKCSGRQASARANHPGSTSRASATIKPAQGGTEQEPPFEHEVGGQPTGRAGAHPEHAENDGGDRTDPVQGPARLCARLPPRGGEEGQGRARHEIEQARVGAVVDARRIHAGMEQDAIRTDDPTPRVTVTVTPTRRQPRRP